MRREIRKVDVKEYSDENPSDDIDTAQDEEVQYRSGRLERSSGNASFHLLKNNATDSSADEEPLTLSKAFAGSGSYKMELLRCRLLGKYDYSAKKKRILSRVMYASKEEDLKAKIDESKNCYNVLNANLHT